MNTGKLTFYDFEFAAVVLEWAAGRLGHGRRLDSVVDWLREQSRDCCGEHETGSGQHGDECDQKNETHEQRADRLQHIVSEQAHLIIDLRMQLHASGRENSKNGG